MQSISASKSLLLAVQHHESGRLPEAEAMYHQILQNDPDHPDALHLLGVIAHQAGKNEEAVNLIEEIEYKENRLVMFLNTPNSIHGVSKRSKTNCYRKYVNIIGEFNFDLFNFRQFLEK